VVQVLMAATELAAVAASSSTFHTLPYVGSVHELGSKPNFRPSSPQESIEIYS
jgi:hypothetical protein